MYICPLYSSNCDVCAVSRRTTRREELLNMHTEVTNKKSVNYITSFSFRTKSNFNYLQLRKTFSINSIYYIKLIILIFATFCTYFFENLLSLPKFR